MYQATRRPLTETEIIPKRPNHQRGPEDFKPGVIAPWPEDKPPPADVADRVRYLPSGEHKNYPSEQGLWTLGSRSDKAKCQHLSEHDWPRLVVTLRQAILAPVASQEFRGDFPSRVWAYINGVLHEARLSNQQTGEYHGFPLEYPEQFPTDRHNLLRLAPRVTFTVV